MAKRLISSENYTIPVILAILIHVLILGIFFIVWSNTPEMPVAKPTMIATLYGVNSISPTTTESDKKLAGSAKKTKAPPATKDQLAIQKDEKKKLEDQKAQKEAAAKAQKEVAEKAQKEVAEKAQKEAAEKAQKEAAEKAQKEAAAKAQKEVAEKAQKEAAAKAQKEVAEKAQKEAAEKAKKEAAEKAKKEAAEKAKKEAAEKAQKEAADKAKKEAAEKAKKEAEEKAKKEAAEKAKKEAAEKAKRDAAKSKADEAALKGKEAKEAQALADLLGDKVELESTRGDQIGDKTVGSLDGLIQQLVKDNWTELGNPAPGTKVELTIQMTPDGTITNVIVSRSSGNAAFDASAVSAAKNVGRISQIQKLDINTFNQLYRQRTFIFTAKGS